MQHDVCRPRWIARRASACICTCIIASLIGIAPAADAKLDIEIEGVRAQLEDNVRAFLSLSRYADRDDISEDTLRRLARRIPGEAAEALKPFGYYASETRYEMQPAEQGWRIDIHVEPGSAVRFSDVEIELDGPGAADENLVALRTDRNLKPGRRLSHAAYDRKKADLLRVANNRGYLEAKLTRHELVIDPETRRAQAYLMLDTGPRYAFGRVDIAQDVLRDPFMERLIRFREGDPYTLDSLLTTQYVLDDSQYFSTVELETARPDREAHTVPVTITAQPGRKHRYTASVGYATDTKARGRLAWDNRRVNDRGHRAHIETTASSVVSELTGRYVIPVHDIALEKLEFIAGGKREELGDVISKQIGVSTGLTQALGSWQRVLFVRLSREESLLPDERRRDFLIIPGISYATLPINALGWEPRRWTLFTELSGSPSTFGSDASYLRFRAEGERIFDFTDLWHLRLRGQIGSSWVADFSELPASQRFFAGGDRSVRGFALNELSPVDDAGNKIGARHLLTGTIELERDLPRNFGVAAFYDIGNAINDFNDPLEYSVGVGMRYRIAVVSVGIDVAQPLSESGHGPRLHLNMSALF
jgi:translocation and assembly module TamA